MDESILRSTSCNLQFRTIQPDFLQYGPYSNFVASIKQLSYISYKEISTSSSLENIEIIQNVYRYSDPVIAEQDGITLLLFVYYDLNDPLLQNTEIYYTIYNGVSFTTPTPIFDDTKADFNPQLSSDMNGNFVAVWERVKDPNFTTEDMIARSDIKGRCLQTLLFKRDCQR